MSNFDFTLADLNSANKFIYQKNNDHISTVGEIEYSIISIIVPIGAIFNILNILHILFRFCKNESAKASELIAYMNFSSLINVISYRLYFNLDPGKEIDPVTNVCKIQGSLMVFSELSQFATATIISVYISNNIFNFQSNEISLKNRLIKILFGFIFPLLIVFIGNMIDIFGSNSRWCWIKWEYRDSYGIAFYVIIWLTMIFNISLIIYSYFKIRKAYDFNMDNQDQIKYEMSHFKTMAIFPLLLIICWFFPTLNRIMMFFKADDDQNATNDIIEILHVIMILLLGVFISVTSFLFVDLKRLWEIIIGCFKKLFCKCCQKRKSNTGLLAENLISSLETSSTKD